MPIVRWSPSWDPFAEMERMFDDMHPVAAKGFHPSVDIYSDDGNFIIESPLQGVSPEDLSIEIENDVLVIEGKTEKRKEVEDKNYYRREVRYGSFHRAIPLPAGVEGDKAQAEYDDGILRVTVPKAEDKPDKKSLKIEIKKK